MQSNLYHNRPSQGANVELYQEYQEVFRVLDNLGMADLKRTFQEHCIQDQTLSYVETEDELKQLLREIGIPLGRCIPIMKSWSKRYSSQDQVKNQVKVSTADKSSQTSTDVIDASIQTDDIFITATDYNRILNNMSASMADMNTQQELLNHYAALASGEYNLKLNEVHSGTLSSDQIAASYGTQQVDPYTAAQMWSTINQYPEYAANVYGAFLQQAPPTGVPGNMVANTVANQGAFKHDISGVNHVTTAPSQVPTQEMGHHQRMTASMPEHKDIVDEREDLAIEQSLKDFENMELESQHSYASALNSAETAGLSQDSQHSYGSNADHTSYYAQPSQRPPSSSISQQAMWQTQTVSKPVTTEKAESSHFAKCDDITLESGTARSSSSQNVGPQTLQGYLDSLPETKEYKEAMQSRNPKKGWKPIDGKHITSGKKVAFKPIFWDNEGRMRHGVRVRGSDKSEECWRHVEGKAPAGCTFAHSRLGDTLQFICVKCSYERGPHDWCSEKTKHKQYIFNLGAYRNLEGGIWKKTS